MNRRHFIALSAAALGGAALSPGQLFGESIAFDLVLRGGTLVDGLGGPPRRGDIGIVGDTIAALGDLGSASARRSFDVSGKFVAPGFVDLHSHSDWSLRECPTADSRIRQGITTEIAGNCGSSVAPVPAGAEGFPDLPAYFSALEEKGIALNQALLVGQGNLRERALGAVDRPATAEEITRMCGELESALAAGAIGLSTGLEYVPGIYTPAAEIEALARVAARHGALYSTHMRNEVDGVLDAIDESVEIARRTGVRLQISHLKVVGRPFWPLQQEALHRIERARNEGIDVMADVYPYTAYSTGLSILLPGWAREGGTEPLLARLAEPATRARIRDEVAAYVARDPGDFDLVVISSVGKQGPAGAVGKSILAIARGAGVEPAESALALIAATRDEASFVGFGMSEENVAKVLAHPLVAVGSDGYALRAEDNDADRPHPRSYGTCPRVLARYCRDLGVLDLATAVRKMTAMPADRAGLSDRGRLLVGTKADLVVFDLAALADRATYEEPKLYPSGIERVYVNGVAVVEESAPTGTRPGRVLRRGAAAVAIALALAAGASGPSPAAAQPAAPAPTSAEILAAASDSDWRPLDPENTLYLELASGRVVFTLAPEFAPKHVANVEALAREHYYDGLAIVRVQENYVVQWGDPDAEDEAKRKPIAKAARTLAAELSRAIDPKLPFTPLPDGDVYAPAVGFAAGFPAARDPAKETTWLAHCYGMLGAGRGDTEDSGGGAELYVVIGHAPRHLDKNVTLLGRAVWGMEHLSTLPRGSGPLGFYERREQMASVVAVRVAADLPPAERTELELLRTDTPTFAAWIEARRNRKEPWFLDPVGRVELCNVPLPVRPRAAR